MQSRTRSEGRLFGDGVRPSAVVAALLVLVGIPFLVLLLLSPSRLYWTGRAVQGADTGGIVYYKVDGQSYSVDDSGAATGHGAPTTVYVDRSDPGNALVQRPTRWIDAASVLVWFAAAAAVVALPALRRVRVGRRSPVTGAPSDTFGRGFAPGSMARYREMSERPQAPPHRQ
jgi:hypothetical protein